MLHSDIASIADSKKAVAFDSSTSTRNGLTGTYILRNRSAIPFAAFDPLGSSAADRSSTFLMYASFLSSVRTVNSTCHAFRSHCVRSNSTRTGFPVLACSSSILLLSPSLASLASRFPSHGGGRKRIIALERPSSLLCVCGGKKK